MSRTKIDASEWCKPYVYDKKHLEYKAKTPYYQKLRSDHGGSTALTACGFCGTEHEVYIWSFNGCGKRCTSCNALIFGGYTWAKKANVYNLKPEKPTL